MLTNNAFLYSYFSFGEDKSATDMEVASGVKSWLQFAKDRNGVRQRRAAARIQQAVVQQQ